ncbi:galactosyl transferase GMA12/MNN10 family-domain-containing protein, partial [Spinellus fusiger]
ESGHYAQVVIIASEAASIERRSLLRELYFGLTDTATPCMSYNTDVYYKFWIHGALPASDTPLKRAYEGEKIEWNDLYETNATYTQRNILAWADNELAKTITYDYLLVQDIHTFMQLNTIKRELDTGVISEETESPVTLTTDAPTNVVWGTFGTARDTHAFVIGAAAVRLALNKQKEFKGDLLTEMYRFYDHYSSTLEKAADDVLEPEAAAEAQEQVIPEFIREDGPQNTQRFIQWENNVESVHAEDIVVTSVYQDNELAALARWTYLEPVPVCHPKRPPPAAPVSVPPPSIALVTSSYIYGPCMEPSAALSAKNKRDYALQHHYAFVARSAEFAQQIHTGRRAVWGKIDAIEKVLPKYDWVFWMDMDAVIMNPNTTLEAILDKVRHQYPQGVEAFDTTVDWVIARPSRDPMINAGVFFVRNTPTAMQFLRDLQAMKHWYQKGPSYEQGAMWELMQHPEHARHVYLLDRDDHTFNTFPRFYQKGNFIVHFAPDKCPNDATLKGLAAAHAIALGHTVT